MKHLIAVTTLACLSFSALADEALIRKAVEPKLGKVDRVIKAPLSGLWEVTAGTEVFYVDDKATYVIAGNLIDIKNDKNLTAERRKELERAAVKLMFGTEVENAVKQVRGNGKNVVVSFEDPNCGYCKKLAQEFAKMKDVTIYTFLFPVLGEDSVEKSKAIWCAPDKAKAWNDWMLSGVKPPEPGAKCDTAGLEKSKQLGIKLRINGTPAMFFANGERSPGYMPAAEIQKRFGKAGG